MADNDTSDKYSPPRGLDEAPLAGRGGDRDPGATGDLTGGDEPSGGLLSSAGATTAGLTDDQIAAEAAALGPNDGGAGQASTPTIGEAVGSGAGRATPGSGTPSDRGETGGGGPAGQHGGTGPGGSASPGGDSRG
ncbi:MAG: hypothetical protein JWL74_1455 [Alphaproteobacteria bacterium]|jgi:hypothetical protein|nr:hypothetical protein [Alphaproteobacteria bacterium]